MSNATPWRALEADVTGGIDRPLDGSGAGAGSPVTSEPNRGAPLIGPGPVGGLAVLAGSPWILAGVAVAALLAAAAVWLVLSSGRGTVVVDGDRPGPARSATTPVAALGSTAPGAPDRSLVVDVQGAVAHPGIVELAPGSRVADAIAAAGGYGPRVAADRVGRVLNLAAPVKDGDQVVVPSRDDPDASPGAGGSTSGGTGSAGAGQSGGGGAGGPIDLNRATLAELDALPGIGPVTAAKILAARDEQPFASVDDLRTRKILGAATFDKVKDLVMVR